MHDSWLKILEKRFTFLFSLFNSIHKKKIWQTQLFSLPFCNGATGLSNISVWDTAICRNTVALNPVLVPIRHIENRNNIKWQITYVSVFCFWSVGHVYWMQCSPCRKLCQYYGKQKVNALPIISAAQYARRDCV